MGSVTNIFDEVKQRLGNRSGIDARILTWLNYAFVDLLQTPRYKFYELDAVATFESLNDLRFYSITSVLPTNFWFILMIRDNDHEREVIKKDIKEFDRLTHTTGIPTRYARFGDLIYLDPTPDGIYEFEVKYRLFPGTLALVGETGIGQEWDEPLVQLSTIKGYQGLEQTLKAKELLIQYEAFMGRREEAYRLEDMDAEPTIYPWMEERT